MSPPFRDGEADKRGIPSLPVSKSPSRWGPWNMAARSAISDLQDRDMAGGAGQIVQGQALHANGSPHYPWAGPIGGVMWAGRRVESMSPPVWHAPECTTTPNEPCLPPSSMASV